MRSSKAGLLRCPIAWCLLERMMMCELLLAMYRPITGRRYSQRGASAQLSFGRSALFAAGLVLCGGLAAQEAQVSTRAIKFETNEGTWMDVDVSPDGQTVVFNIL